MKKICSLFLAVILLFAALPLTAHAAEIVDSGYCGGENFELIEKYDERIGKCLYIEGDGGTNLSWKVDSDGVLTISGTGEMRNYMVNSYKAPWNGYGSSWNGLVVKKVIVEEGVTTIGDWAFADGNYDIDSILLPSTLSRVGFQAFNSYPSRHKVYFCGNAPEGIDEYAFGYNKSSIMLYYIESKEGWTTPTWNGYKTATWDGPAEVEPAEYIASSADPGDALILDGSTLSSVTGKTEAVTVVTNTAAALTAAQKTSTTGVDKLTRYAEGAVYHAATGSVGGIVNVSESSIGTLSKTASETAAAVANVLTGQSVALNRDLMKTVRLVSSENSVTVRVNHDALNTEADRVLVETDAFALTVDLQNLSALLENGTQTFTVKTVGTGYGTENENSVTTVELSVPGGSLSEPVILSLEPAKGDVTYQTVVTADGTAVPSKYNAISGKIEARIRTDGRYTIMTNEKNFTDITNKSSEMQSAIKYLASKGIINGTSATTYNPDGSISRAEIAALILRALGKMDEKAANTFTDVPTSKWYYGAAGSSQKYGIINGFEDSTFRGENVITKEQITAVAARVLKNEMGYKVPDDTAKILSAYSDTISNWAKPEVALAALQNLVIARSDGKFLGSGGMTRGEAAVVISRLFSRIW